MVCIGELAFTYLQTNVDDIRPQFGEIAGAHLWVNDWGKRVAEDRYRKAVKKYWREQGIGKYSTHSLRHGAASHMLKNKAPLHAISAFLGHRDISSTEVYTKVEPLELRKAVDELSLE